MPAWPGFIGPTYTAQSVLADAEECVNWYVEPVESQGAQNKMALLPVPGLGGLGTAATFATGVGVRVRALYSGIFKGVERCFAVISSTFYEVSSSGVLTNRGTVVEDANPAVITSNGDGGGAGHGQLFITSGQQGYNYDLTTNTLTKPAGLGPLDFCAMIDGYFLGLHVATSTLQISALLDGTSWDPTQFQQRSQEPDPWRSLIVNYNEAWLPGSNTSDVWYDAGTFPFPFAPRQGAILQQGIAAVYSLKVLEGTTIFLARTLDGTTQVMAAPGYVPQRISTHAMEQQISRYARVDDAVAWVYEDEGHPFYVLNFPTANVTWVYDKRTSLWHKRSTWNAATGNEDAWRPNCHTYAFGMHLVGDRTTPSIYRMDRSIQTDAGAVIRCRRRTPAGTQELHRTAYTYFELYTDVGVGSLDATSPNPVMSMHTSDDGGVTFGSYRTRGLGPAGQYSTRVRWERCGTSRNRVWEVVCSDPVPRRLVNAFVGVRKAMSV